MVAIFLCGVWEVDTIFLCGGWEVDTKIICEGKQVDRAKYQVVWEVVVCKSGLKLWLALTKLDSSEH